MKASGHCYSTLRIDKHFTACQVARTSDLELYLVHSHMSQSPQKPQYVLFLRFSFFGFKSVTHPYSHLTKFQVNRESKSCPNGLICTVWYKYRNTAKCNFF